jgi:hypothetical protein
MKPVFETLHRNPYRAKVFTEPPESNDRQGDLHRLVALAIQGLNRRGKS